MVERQWPKVGDVLLNTKYGTTLFRITDYDDRKFYLEVIIMTEPELFKAMGINWFGKGSVFQTDSYNLRITPKDKIIEAIFGEKR